ncbi:MAG: hypothetical protein ACL93V_06275 [Candidatus Electrothrix sp. YB6]
MKPLFEFFRWCNLLLIGTLILLFAITAEEISQIFIANRTFDLIDLSCSYLGIIVGDVVVRVLKGKRNVAL